MRSVLRSGNVGDGDFRDPCAAPARERRNEPLQIAVEAQALDHRRTICLEVRAECIQPKNGIPPRKPTRKGCRQSARTPLMAPPLAPAASCTLTAGQLAV